MEDKYFEIIDGFVSWRWISDYIWVLIRMYPVFFVIHYCLKFRCSIQALFKCCWFKIRNTTEVACYIYSVATVCFPI